MRPSITRYLNKTVFVSIPTLFDDGACRPFQLLGAEINGLWLQSEELTCRLLPREVGDHATLTPAVFVPLAQIAGVLVAMPLPPPGTAAPAGPTTEAASGPEAKPEKSDDSRRRRKSN